MIKLVFCISLSMIITNNVMAQKVKLITLDPGHFHAALVQKTMYPDVDANVQVYAPKGQDLQWHQDRINSYNTRKENPTSWDQHTYIGDDFFEKMIAEKKGNVVVLSGNNKKKTSYILKSLESGFNVLADKPMVITEQGFEDIKKAFDIAKKKKLMLYDIMTERYEINTILQRELSMIPSIFGSLEKGTVEHPAITKESVHHFYKFVSGSVLTRPAWFLDASQQGEGIVDVMTHLVDLVQWECFPNQIIEYKKNIQINTARRWPTKLGLSQFKSITKTDNFPSFLLANVQDTSLNAYSNGEINYTINGVHAKTSVIWNYKAPDGTGDTHFSTMRGTKANLAIRQGKDENYVPTLYIEPIQKGTGYENNLSKSITLLSAKYPGISIAKTNNGWKVEVPTALREGHETHFARVTENFLKYLKQGKLPAWEVPNMIAKYYTTAQGLKIATQK
jgi:predicted dehydrogenase